MMWTPSFPRTLLVCALVFAPGAFVQVQSQVSQFRRVADKGDPVDVYESARHSFRVVTVVEGLDHPWSIAWLPSGEMLVTERPGRLRIIRNGKLDPNPVSGLPRDPCTKAERAL